LNARENLASAEASRQLIQIGKAAFISRGSDLTLVTWGATVSICAKVAETLGAARVSVDLIDLRSISPWDREAVCDSAEKTGTLVVVHEDNLTAGFGAEIIATVNELVPKKIAAKRITRPDTYVPCRFANQLEILPSFKRVLTGISEFLDLDLGWTSGEAADGAFEFVKALGSSPADRTVTIVSWKIKTNDTVSAGDIIADVESDKAVAELACPTSGIVEEILVMPGNSVPVGTPILRLRPVTPGERLTPTIVLQRGQPVVKRKDKPPPRPAPDKATAPQTRSARSVVGMSAITTAEGSTIITNEALAARFPNRSAEEIFRLTGIETRRHLAAGESILDLASQAAAKALEVEGLTVSDLDAILCSTTTPVEITPSMACALQARLCPNGELTHLVAYDILAACSGFLYALSSAFNLLQTRPTAKVMVVTAEALSKVINHDDFDTAILFGDAATAVFLYGPANLHRARILVHAPVVGAKPDPERILHVPNPGSGFVEMEGKRVFGEAVRTMMGALEQACSSSSLKLEDLNFIVPHQANGRIIEAVRTRLGASGDRVINQVRHRGNTSSCTIPLCLSELDGQLKPGNRLGLCAFGGGFTFGAAILEVNSKLQPTAQLAGPRSGAFSITAADVIPNTVIVDVTENPEWAERARWLTAEAYVALANPKMSIGLEDVFDVVSGDVYEQPGRSRTFVALTTDPQSGCTKISGTLRLVLGKNDESCPAVPPIDAMNFMATIEDWPHKQRGWADSEIAELGRFFIPERYRTLAMRRAGVDVWLSHQLHAAAARVALTQKARIIYIIMPAYVTKLFPVPIHEIESKLKTDDPLAASVFEQYSLYWQRSHPRLYYHFPDALAKESVPVS
jgi:2-oxoisovalerate dehydrogenase E1 component